MNLLPIVQHELRKASVRSGTYWSRFVVGFLGVTILGAILISVQLLPFVNIRMPAVFKTVRFFALIYCLFVGVRLTSDCISQEKRDGTLGFLFLTPLRGYDVILGKLISKGLGPTYSMMVFVPLVWFVSLVGGISVGEQFYTVIALGNALFFSLAIGVATSTFLKDRRRCEAVASGAVFILFFAVFPFVDLWIHSLLTSAPVNWVIGKSVFDLLIDRVNAFANPSFSALMGGNAVIISNVVVFATSLLFVAAASWWAPRCWKERPPAGVRLSFRQRWSQWTYGSGLDRARRRRLALEANPFYWRATRNRLRPFVPWVFMILTLGVPAAILGAFGFNQPLFYFLLMAFVMFWYLAPKIWIAHEASRTLSEERADGTLEMILSTPITVDEIIHGQWMALRKCYLVAVIFSVITIAALLVVTHLVPAAHGIHGTPYVTTVVVCALIMFLLDCVTIGWVGMWCGVKLGNAKAAARATTSQVITYPMLVFAVCFLVAAIWIPSSRFSPASPFVPIGLWLFTGVAFDILLIKSSRSLLFREFRSIVQEPALAQNAWARGLGRWLAHKLR